MAELASYIGIEPRTLNNASGSTIARGLRVVLGATDQITLAGIGPRGDFVTLQDVANNETGAGASLQGGGKVPMVASVAVAMGDLAYGAANGQASNVAAGAILLGRWTQPASGAGVLSEVELFNPA
jgi:hypothetical protein